MDRSVRYAFSASTSRWLPVHSGDSQTWLWILNFVNAVVRKIDSSSRLVRSNNGV